jgi:succinate dehydrogenase / fumarate reductase, cytochrome b subunit
MSLKCFFCSSIGKKVIMAITGLMLFGFVIAHLLGNLQVFVGREKFNDYAAFLKSLGGLLWVARIGLIAVFVLHIKTAISLSRENRGARPEEYRSQATIKASPASLYMLQSGMLLLIFVVIHLLHFTFGMLQPETFNLFDAAGRHDVYSMLIYGFKNSGYATIYIVCMVSLGFHLSHAIWSLFQTLGLTRPGFSQQLKILSNIIGCSVALGYISIPLAVMSNIVGL